MKKVLASALICAASSFAAWDYFPVIEYGKGEAKFSFEQGRKGNNAEPNEDHDFKIRYSPLENLELLSQLGYTFGARYQIIPVLSAGLDIGFPIPGTAWSFTPNVQFSTNLTEALALGSNVQVTINTEDAGKNSNGLDLSAGFELDITMGKSTIWVSCDFNTGLTDSKKNGTKIKAKDDDRGTEIVPALGYVAAVGNLSLGTSVGMKFGENAGHDKFVTVIGLDASIKF
ncbi:MAG: transporter [Fibromonadales bacterium]|nr:transporter [Fibromonadales bacterium]